MYDVVKRMQELYSRLQDQQSRALFVDRFAIDMEPSMTNTMKLCAHAGQVTLEQECSWKSAFHELNQAGEKIVLYGASIVGRDMAAALQCEKVEFYGFCNREYARFPDGLMGKPVISPNELLNHPNQYYVVIATGIFYYAEIEQILRDHDFPEKRILKYFGMPEENQYFEFPSLYHKGTEFVDCGCYNCADCYTFVEWCGGEYSKIYAFEPDPANVENCKKYLKQRPIENIQLVPKGVSNETKTVEFGSDGGVTSHILRDDPIAASNSVVVNRIILHTTTIDETVGDERVGFIKMDIEGAEFEALHGAEATIIRDKPFLAICVYHQQGDTIAFMDYLQKLVPEYRFWLRHYGPARTETVLYASI